MTEWSLWLNSRETRIVLSRIKEAVEDINEFTTNGSLLRHEQVDQIAVDYAHQLGVLEGLKQAIKLIKEEEEDD